MKNNNTIAKRARPSKCALSAISIIIKGFKNKATACPSHVKPLNKLKRASIIGHQIRQVQAIITADQ